MNIFLSLLILSYLGKLIYVTDVFDNLLLHFLGVFDDDNCFVTFYYFLRFRMSSSILFILAHVLVTCRRGLDWWIEVVTTNTVELGYNVIKGT
jgi:hypothetical protein